MDQMNVEQRWKQGFCPIISGIAFGNGDVYWIQIMIVNYIDQRPVYELSAPNFSKNRLVKNDFEDWMRYCTLVEKVVSEKNIHIFAGEGGMGSEGFICVKSLTTENVKWIAVFDESNPFVELDFNVDTIIATSSHGNQWKFPLDTPQFVQVD